MGNDQKKPQLNTYHPDIVVVSEKQESTTSSTTGDLNKLQHVPLFYPILKSTVDIKEDRVLFQINPEHIIRLSNHLQNHLHTCAFNVTKDQEAVTADIKNLNLVIDMLMQNFIDKQHKYAKYCDQFKIVHDLSHNLKKIQRSMDEILPMMNEINQLFPEEDRLEEFTF